MKYISFAIPCYNSQAYMRKCIDSILTGGEDVEIIVVNDGSKDDTIKIANEYQEKYPTIVKVIDKENGGHGSGVNAGLKMATGMYYKVVDSDDWVGEEDLKQLLDTIKQHEKDGNLADLYITNFVYEHVEDGTSYVSDYVKMMPVNEFFGWDVVKKFHTSHLLLMHALVYKREPLLESNTVLPEHTFYVDNLFAYKPLPFMKKLFYLNVNLYHYFIGRIDQSVTKENISKRYAQQARVFRHVVDSYSLDEINKMPNGLKNYLWHAVVCFTMNTLYFTCYKDDKERRATIKEMWAHLKENDKKMYKKIRHCSYATIVVYLPWKLRGWIMNIGYDILCKVVKLG